MPDPSSLPRLIQTCEHMRDWVRDFRRSPRTLGLVPTMGALHEGHLSLVRRSQSECDATVVSIFVNPTQFGPGEDLERYPRDLEADLAMLRALRVDAVFAPSVGEIYPECFSTSVVPPRVSQSLEGEFRPGHFAGVATVVLKLFHLVPADVACFGSKDYQQALVIQHLVRDLAVPMDIRVCPIVREPDGLAMSSRNRYLSPAQRRVALSLPASLRRAQAMLAAGSETPESLESAMRETLLAAGVDRIDYAVAVDARTLEPMERIRPPLVLLLAAHVGTTRLIDNLVWTG